MVDDRCRRSHTYGSPDDRNVQTCQVCGHRLNVNPPGGRGWPRDVKRERDQQRKRGRR